LLLKVEVEYFISERTYKPNALKGGNLATMLLDPKKRVVKSFCFKILILVTYSIKKKGKSNAIYICQSDERINNKQAI
jgi:hypothetical protein